MSDVRRPGGAMAWLIALLLVTCYAADWTDDLYSYTVANRYSAFQEANGHTPAVIGGGGMNSSAMAGAMRMSGSATDQLHTSALDAVFGSPYGPSPEGVAGGLRSRSGLSGAQGTGSSVTGFSSLTALPE